MRSFRKLPGRTGIVGVLCAFAAALLPSCGSIHTHAGIDHEYSYDFDGHGHHHRPPHHKKHKKHKKKHKKHHHHHDNGLCVSSCD